MLPDVVISQPLWSVASDIATVAIALGALIVSRRSVGLTKEIAEQELSLKKRSVRPILSVRFTVGRDSEFAPQHFHVRIVNDGVGPAIIKSLEIVLPDGTPCENILHVAPKATRNLAVSTETWSSDRAIGRENELILLSVRAAENHDDETIRTEMESAYASIEGTIIGISYTDIYDQDAAPVMSTLVDGRTRPATQAEAARFEAAFGPADAYTSNRPFRRLFRRP